MPKCRNKKGSADGRKGGRAVEGGAVGLRESERKAGEDEGEQGVTNAGVGEQGTTNAGVEPVGLAEAEGEQGTTNAGEEPPEDIRRHNQPKDKRQEPRA